MRLRTRLILSFGALALVPLLAVVPVALHGLRNTFAGELADRADAAERLARSELGRATDDVTRAVAACAADPAADALGRALAPGAVRRPAPDAARALMEGRPLQIFALLDAALVTRSSGHFPARVGDREAGLASVASGGPGPRTAFVELPGPDGPVQRLALLVARPVEDGSLGLTVVGGALLDAAFAARLSALSGARVRISAHDEAEGSAGSGAGVGGEGLVRREVALPDGARLQIAVESVALRATERGLSAALGTVVGIGLLLALGLGLLVARRITRPLEALTAGTQALAEGRTAVHVETDAGGEVGALVGAFNRMTEDLRRTTAALLAAERVAAWEEVARGLAHELKNPLTPLQMSLETLLAAQAARRPGFPELFAESAGPMLEEVERLRRTVDAFSRFARLPPPARAALDLSAWAAQVLAVHAPERAALRTALAPGLTVDGDRDQLTQVFVNLLRNAAEAMPAGGPLWVRARGDGAWAVLEVEDGGPGVPEAERARLFEPSFTTKHGGTGLGLALSQRICVEHGGRLEVETGAAGGALFRIVLPRAASAGTPELLSP